MKITIIITLLLYSIAGFSQKSKPNRIDTANMLHRYRIHTVQKREYIPDCDSNKLFQLYPCKVPVLKNGKTIGYTVKNNPWQGISTATYSGTGLYFNNSISHWQPVGRFSFNIGDTHLFTITQPNANTKTDTLFIKRKNLHWLNDSTAVYKEK